MNYEAQHTYLKKILIKYPYFKSKLRHYRAVWNQTPMKHSWIIIGGYIISDHVILKAELD